MLCKLCVGCVSFCGNGRLYVAKNATFVVSAILPVLFIILQYVFIQTMYFRLRSSIH